MAIHNVLMEIPRVELSSTDVTFQIYRDEELLGWITISKGSIDYTPSRKQSAISLTWSEFDAMMTERWEQA